jgi:(S)-mandelate dehydrogenase
VTLGLDGIVVSNHGGRQLDGAVGSIDCLADIVAVAGGRLAVLIDGGFRSGTDIVKALAFGAAAVQLGRATLYGLATAGEAGVFGALQILRAEIDVAQALCGVPDLATITVDALHAASRPRPMGLPEAVREVRPVADGRVQTFEPRKREPAT